MKCRTCYKFTAMSDGEAGKDVVENCQTHKQGSCCGVRQG